MDIETLAENGIVAENAALATVLKVLIRRHNKGDESITIEHIRNYIDFRREQIAEQAAEKAKERDKYEASNNAKPRPATKRDLNKSRGAVQTRYRRATLGKFDPSAIADKNSNVYDKGSCKSKASKEKKYNRGGEATGWNTSSQGAGNVVGAKGAKLETDYGDRNDRSLGLREYK